MKYPEFFKILTFALLMWTAPQCFSQTQEQLNNLSAFLDNGIQELGRVNMNLLQMNDPSTSVEPSLTHAIDLVTTVDHAMGRVNIYVGVATLMAYEADLKMVKSMLQGEVRNARKITEFCISKINIVLPKLKSPAVILEVQRARDQIVKIQVEIDRSMSGN